MSDDNKRWKLKLLLDESYAWPCEYLFKFIVPLEQVPYLLTILGDMKVDQKPSSAGKYISVTATKTFHSSEEVLKVYESVKVVKGIISL